MEKDRTKVISFREDFEAAPGIVFTKGVMSHFDRETDEGYVIVAEPGLEMTIPKQKAQRVGYEVTVGVCKQEKRGDEELSMSPQNLGREPENEMVALMDESLAMEKQDLVHVIRMQGAFPEKTPHFKVREKEHRRRIRILERIRRKIKKVPREYDGE